MPRWDDFYVTERDGVWKVYIRSSPEDMDEYDLEEGLRRIVRIMRDWDKQIGFLYEAAREAEEKARDLEDRIEEAFHAIRPLFDADLVDEEDIKSEVYG